MMRSKSNDDTKNEKAVKDWTASKSGDDRPNDEFPTKPLKKKKRKHRQLSLNRPLPSFPKKFSKIKKRNGSLQSSTSLLWRKQREHHGRTSWSQLKPQEKVRYEMIRQNTGPLHKTNTKMELPNHEIPTYSMLHQNKSIALKGRNQDNNNSISALCWAMNKTQIHTDHKMEFDEGMDADDEKEFGSDDMNDFGYFSD